MPNYLRLFALPIRLAIMATLSAAVIAVWFPRQIGNSPLLYPLSREIAELGWLGALVLITAAAVASTLRLWQLHRWEQGVGRYCPRCSGMVIERMSRRRFYEECMHCGRRW